MVERRMNQVEMKRRRMRKSSLNVLTGTSWEMGGGGGELHTDTLNLPYHHSVSSYRSSTLYIFYRKPLLKIFFLPNCSVLFLCLSQSSSNLHKPKSSLNNIIMNVSSLELNSPLLNDFILFSAHADSASL